MATMQAVRIHRFGGSEVVQVEQVPLPEAAPDVLLIKVRASSLNPIDCKTRAGQYAAVGAEMLPVTLGWDVSGTIAGGSAGGFREGDAVMAMLSAGHGGFAEYAVAGVSQVAVKPDRVSYLEAACAPLAGLTAWQGLFKHGHLQSGQRVLIHGGAGGVGHLAVQFAKYRGAHVFATASAADVEFLQQLGVDRVIDYRGERFEDIAGDLDLVLDLIGGDTQARSVATLKPGGALVSTVAEPDAASCAAQGIHGGRYVTEPAGSDLAEIARLLDEGRILVTVSQSFPLGQAGEAMQRLERGGVRGKLGLEVA